MNKEQLHNSQNKKEPESEEERIARRQKAFMNGGPQNVKIARNQAIKNGKQLYTVKTNNQFEQSNEEKKRIKNATNIKNAERKQRQNENAKEKANENARIARRRTLGGSLRKTKKRYK